MTESLSIQMANLLHIIDAAVMEKDLIMCIPYYRQEQHVCEDYCDARDVTYVSYFPVMTNCSFH